ncbi:hypothetical protein GGTG_01077 [Gaeumannomyces tritici R3-111a-1]|uniref:Uncharacterized protein n=1 Tax=Gaeumannomyces tritici (strain R3-111a-1) TaxID=644352 RepID=J3NIJ8_GAET3|nr:hypothetical protein GGTG_01077 [Gaeumannomyces tritici R3-111a-1]EJT81091.1 hypothetical protein GGTG_01077 [Gaeumannomyces tritici R3-111a-1]
MPGLQGERDQSASKPRTVTTIETGAGPSMAQRWRTRTSRANSDDSCGPPPLSLSRSASTNTVWDSPTCCASLRLIIKSGASQAPASTDIDDNTEYLIPVGSEGDGGGPGSKPAARNVAAPEITTFLPQSMRDGCAARHLGTYANRTPISQNHQAFQDSRPGSHWPAAPHLLHEAFQRAASSQEQRTCKPALQGAVRRLPGQTRPQWIKQPLRWTLSTSWAR